MRNPIRRLARPVSFAAVTCGTIVLAAVTDRLPQNPEYHRFADTRLLLSIPNACDVLSNLAFVVVGAWGLAVVLRTARFVDPRERLPWLVMFAGVALTGVGSAWYHLGPTNASLVWDRLPMTLGFMGLFAALVTERVSVRAGVALLSPLLLLGFGSVVYWALTEARGAGDLRPYLLVQFYPLVAILLLLALFPARYTRPTDLLVALAWYVAAKAAESFDRTLFGVLGFVSGHTLKHLFAAVGAAWVARMLAFRWPLRAAEGRSSGREGTRIMMTAMEDTSRSARAQETRGAPTPRATRAAGAITVLLALPLVAHAGPGEAAPLCPSFSATVSTTAPGAASPEAAWRKAREAMRMGDFRTYVEAISPETRGECVCEIYWFIAMAHHGEIREADLTELNAILRRHGLDELRETPDPPGAERPTMREAVQRVRDPAAFYAEAMRFLLSHRMGYSCGGIPYWLRFDPDEVHVDGDRASAAHAVLRTVKFDRIGGAWFVRGPEGCIRDFDAEDRPKR